jgi:hypothetical protein
MIQNWSNPHAIISLLRQYLPIKGLVAFGVEKLENHWEIWGN